MKKSTKYCASRRGKQKTKKGNANKELFEQKFNELEEFVKSSDIYTSVERGIGYSFEVYENKRGKFNTRTNVASVWYYSERGTEEKRQINMFFGGDDYQLWKQEVKPLKKLLLEFPEFISSSFGF